MLGTLIGVVVCAPAGAQQVYKCGARGTVVYSQQPCSNRMVDTEQAGAPAKPNPKGVDAQRLEQNRVMARSLRQRPGESTEQFETRRRRARLLETDRDECARIDVRMPVEAASLTNPDKVEVQKAEAALVESRRRFGELGC
ncbi:MAG: DUF4124 domain-containing protein [Ramlibacter sp.]|nr:DUF4124 domain-containing protein [Ramlibacter sp.]